MKKLKLTEMELTQMSIGKRELLNLRGGKLMANNNETGGCICNENINSDPGCSCTYDNTPIYVNSNSVEWCTCTCI
jgi:hypothetical protein